MKELEPVLDREARRVTWKLLKLTLRFTHPFTPVQTVLNNEGRLWVMEYGQYINLSSVMSNLNRPVLTPMLVCPSCQKQVRVLWLRDDVMKIGCRDCCKIIYSSRKRQPSDMLTATKLYVVKLHDKQPDRFGKNDTKIDGWREDVAKWL